MKVDSHYKDGELKNGQEKNNTSAYQHCICLEIKLDGWLNP